MTVESIDELGPAGLSGFKVGDRLLSVDTTDLSSARFPEKQLKRALDAAKATLITIRHSHISHHQWYQ